MDKRYVFIFLWFCASSHALSYELERAISTINDDASYMQLQEYVQQCSLEDKKNLASMLTERKVQLNNLRAFFLNKCPIMTFASWLFTEGLGCFLHFNIIPRYQAEMSGEKTSRTETYKIIWSTSKSAKDSCVLVMGGISGWVTIMGLAGSLTYIFADQIYDYTIQLERLDVVSHKILG